MLTRLADLGIAVPRRILAAAGLLFALAAVFGAPVADHLSSGGFNDPRSQSARANDVLATKFDAGDANLVLEVSTPDGVASAAARTAGLALTSEVRCRG